MKVTLNKDELQRRLADIQSIVEKKTTMPILSHFLLDLKRQRSFIYATDLEVAIREPIEVEAFEEEGLYCVSARKLYEIAKELEGEVRFEGEGTEWVRLRSGHSNFRIACLNPEDYPHWPHRDDNKKLTINSKTLLDMIEKTIYCAGENDPRYALNGVLLHCFGEKGKAVMVGTDSHRLAVVSKEVVMDFADEVKVIVPRKAVFELKRILSGLDEELSVEISKNHIHFTVGEKEFLTKIIEGSYPGYEQVIPVNNDKTLLANREEFIRTLRRVSVIGREKSKAIRFEIGQGELNVSVSDPEIGEASDSMEIEFSSENPIVVGFNGKYLLETLMTMESERVSISFMDNLNPTLIRQEDSDDYRCVLMPMRI